MVSDEAGGSAVRDTAPGVFQTARNISIPPTDVVSYAFERYGSYDVNKPIYVDADNATNFISARKARQMVRQLIGGFRAHGLEVGDCVCLHAYNNILYPLVWLAVIGAGGCISGSNPAYNNVELKHHIQTTNSKFIISQNECLSAIAQAARDCGIPTSRVFVLAPSDAQLSDGYLSYEVLLDHGESDWESFDSDNGTTAASTVAVLGSTSGTTGLPKSAALSHRYVVAQSAMIQEKMGRRSHEVSQLVCLPVFHAFAAQLALVLPLHNGMTTYFMRRFNLGEFAGAVHKYSITDSAVVPLIASALLKLAPVDHHLLGSLRYIICAGAPMNAQVQAKLNGQLSPEAVVAQCWGTTETGWITLFGAHEKDNSGSVGTLLPGVQMKIVDEGGKLVTEDNVHGEGLVRSPSTFSDYVRNPGSTASSFDPEGFYRTGDRIFTRGGKVFVDGRIKDIIKVKGWQVSPAELEAVILQHPRILDVAVVGVFSPNSNGLDETVPRAFVVRKPNLIDDAIETGERGAPSLTVTLLEVPLLSESDVVAFVASRVISYKRLAGGVMFVDKIPRSTTGKVLRRLLGDGESSSRPKLLPRSTANTMDDLPRVSESIFLQKRQVSLPVRSWTASF